MAIVDYIRGLSRKEKVLWLLAVAFVTVLALIPMVINVDVSYFGYYVFLTCIYLTIAQGWNLIGGYTGQVSLGQNAFFGIGAYITAGMWIHGIGLYFFFDFAIMITAGILPALLAAVIGLPLLARLRGDYFAFGTLGFSMIILVLFLKGGKLTGGAFGVQLDSSVFNGMLIYYWVGLAVATICTLAVYFITHSRIGLALRAIREDEISAASHGVNVLKYKVISFMIGSFMAGVAGSIYAYYLFDVKPPDVFNMNWLFYPILIVVLGGTGTVFGPVIGAFIVSALFAYGNVYFSGYQTVFSGLLIILVMLFMPEGLMGVAARVPKLWRRSPALADGPDAAEQAASTRT
jgi:branched-chain amino acid transport system permease protein